MLVFVLPSEVKILRLDLLLVQFLFLSIEIQLSRVHDFWHSAVDELLQSFCQLLNLSDLVFKGLDFFETIIQPFLLRLQGFLEIFDVILAHGFAGLFHSLCHSICFLLLITDLIITLLDFFV